MGKGFRVCRILAESKNRGILRGRRNRHFSLSDAFGSAGGSFHVLKDRILRNVSGKYGDIFKFGEK